MQCTLNTAPVTFTDRGPATSRILRGGAAESYLYPGAYEARIRWDPDYADQVWVRDAAGGLELIPRLQTMIEVITGQEDPEGLDQIETFKVASKFGWYEMEIRRIK